MEYSIHVVRAETKSRQQQASDPGFFDNQNSFAPFSPEQRARLASRLARYGFVERGQAGALSEFDNPSSGLTARMTERALTLGAADRQSSIFNALTMASELSESGEFAAWDCQARGWDTLKQNTSGQGKDAEVPAEIRGWNWGAFLLNWIWGLGNTTYVALLALVPLFGIAMPFVLGAKGNEWAWQNRRWNSVAEFKAAQRKWAWWGAGLWLFFVAAFAALFFGITSMLKDSAPYRQARALLERDVRVAAQYGAPLSSGTPTGNVQVSGPDGTASLQFSVEGSKAEGTAYVEARRRLGRWEIEHLVVEHDDSGARIALR